MSKSTEKRVVDVELRAEGEDGKRRLVGYAAVFNRDSSDLGGFTESIRPGAFRDAIADGADVRALVDHDSSRILGRTLAGTLRLSEDKVGLRMEVDLPDTSVGRDIYESVTRGDISQQSFAFRTLEDEWRKKDGKHHRELVSVELFDVGPVTFPAYADTSIAARSLEEWRSENDPEPPAEQETSDQSLAMAQARQRQAEALGR